MKGKLSLGTLPKNRQAVDIKKDELLIELERYLTYEKRYSKTNIKTIMSRIHRIVYYYKIERPGPEDAIAIEEDLKQRDLRGHTIRHYLRALELMSEYQGVPLKLKKPKSVFKIPDILSLAECRALVQGARNTRDRAVIMLLLYTGLRNKELINLELQDLADIKNRILFVRDHGQEIKNRHERKAVLSEECAAALKDWLQARPHVESELVFITQFGKAMSKERLERLVQESAARVGIEKRVYPHLLRHTCASMMLRSGVPLTDVALQLGHRSLNSTMTYLHSDVDSLKENVDKKFRY